MLRTSRDLRSFVEGNPLLWAVWLIKRGGILNALARTIRCMVREEMSIYGEMERGWKPNIVDISPTCPRCGSSNTKFCYYNNYSLTQPRYFCKGCRRYWTKGGSLRNVPVGGGCRKSRRTRLLRASFTPNGLNSSRSFGVGNSLGHDHEITPRYSESSGGSTDGSNIDLASVYANFLNHKQELEPEPEQEQKRELGLPPEFSEFPNAVGLTCEFSSVYENAHMDYLSAHQLLSNENNSGESRRVSISNQVSNSTFLEDQNGVYFCGINSIEEQQDLEHCFMGDYGNNYVLPPLPEVDGVSDGMVWPSSDVNFQNDIPKAQDPSQENINQSECSFDISDYGIFSGLGK